MPCQLHQGFQSTAAVGSAVALLKFLGLAAASTTYAWSIFKRGPVMLTLPCADPE